MSRTVIHCTKPELVPHGDHWAIVEFSTISRGPGYDDGVEYIQTYTAYADKDEWEAAVQDKTIAVSNAPEAVRPPEDVRTGNLDCIQAMEAMRNGKIVRRFNGGAGQKYHRVHNGVVQTAETANKVVDGEWERAKTDIDSWYNSTFSWYNSTFRVVTTMVRIVELGYEK